MKRIILLFLLIMLLASCSHTDSDENCYPQDTSVSSAQGVPQNPHAFYFPPSLQIDGQITETMLDTFLLNWFSSALYAAEEPILHNYYLGHDIYRFLWLRSFHRPVVFSLHKNGDQVWMTTKMLDKQPNFMEMVYVHHDHPEIDTDGNIELAELDQPNGLVIDSISTADRKATIVLNETKQLSKREWEEFEQLLIDCSYWSLEPHVERMGLDGSEWTLEAHLKNRYWLVNRWSPEGDIRRAGEYLIVKSGLKEDIY